MEVAQMAFLIYVAEVLGNIQVVLMILGILTIIGAAVGVLMSFIDENHEANAKCRKWLIGGGMAWVVAAFFPTSTGVYMMIAADLAETQITSESGQELIGKVRQLIDAKIDEAIIGATRQ